MNLWGKILFCAVLAVILGGLGAYVTSGSLKTWYVELEKPPGVPPNEVFGPVWTVLYLMIGTSFALLWHRAKAGPQKRTAMRWHAAQMILNLAWTPVFFGAHELGAALIVIALLWGAIVTTIKKALPLDRVAAWLLIPYLAWVSYATYLNAGFWWLNR